MPQSINGVMHAEASPSAAWPEETISFRVNGPGLHEATVREPAHFTVEAFDGKGVRMACGGEPIFIAIRGVSQVRARLSDMENGLYEVEWKPTVSGHYSISISSFGISVPGSPFAAIARTPEPAPSRCMVRGKALYDAVARQVQSFEVSFKDRLGAKTHAVDLDVFVEPVAPGSPRNPKEGGAVDRDRPRPANEDDAMQRRGSVIEYDGERRGSITSAPWTGDPKDAKDDPREIAERAQIAKMRGRAGRRGIIEPEQDLQKRYRRIRVKVGDRPLVVRAQYDLSSALIGQLLPGAVVTVIEERVRPGHVRACISLDYMGKETSSGLKSERGYTFRSSNAGTYRANATERDMPSHPAATPESTPGGSTTRRRTKAGQMSLSDLVTLTGASAIRGGAEAARSRNAGSNSDRSLVAASVESGPDESEETTDAMGDPDISDPSDLMRAFDNAAAALQAETSMPAVDDSIYESSTVPEEIDRLRAKIEAANALSVALDAMLQQDALEDSSELANLAEAEERNEKDTKADRDQRKSGESEEEEGDEEAEVANNEEVTKEPPIDDTLDDFFDVAAKQTVVGGHSRIQERYGMKLSTQKARLAEKPPVSPAWAAAEDDPTELIGRTGWITLVKDGQKFVSSRLRLDPGAKWQQKETWSRRVGLQTYKPDGGTIVEEEAPSTPNAMRLKQHIELKASDASSFAFGGIHPPPRQEGQRGQLFETHKVSYSIGVAGQYLMHVRLRKQAASLPGSPFMLSVQPGGPCAPSTFLQGPIFGEVKPNPIVLVLTTADRMGNLCTRGGGDVTTTCNQEGIESKVVDQGDGTYRLEWLCTRIGIFDVSVMIDKQHVVNSPTKLTVASTTPCIAKSELIPSVGITGPVSAGHECVVRLRFRDTWGNKVLPNAAFRASFKCCFGLQKSKEKIPSVVAIHDREVCKGRFMLAEGGGAEYEFKYVPTLPANLQLHLYAFEEGIRERIHFSGSPFPILVNKSADSSDSAAGVAVIDAFPTAMPGDYKIQLSVFEEAESKWGKFSVDAFASPATHQVPRFWMAKKEGHCEHVDAFSEPKRWKRSERIWAHPPAALLDKLCDLLENPERLSEVVVCAPAHKSQAWFFRLTAMADDQRRYGAGKLVKVAPDAPARIGETPIVLFHMAARKRSADERRGSNRRGSTDANMRRGSLASGAVTPPESDSRASSPGPSPEAQRSGGGRRGSGDLILSSTGSGSASPPLMRATQISPKANATNTADALAPALAEALTLDFTQV